MLKWEKTGRFIRPDCTALQYRADGTRVVIESRTKKIPHANGEGTWEHTSYFVVMPNGMEHEFWRLQDAKKAVENWREL